MKIMAIGDMHLSSRSPISRLDDYGATTIKKLNAMTKIAIEQEVDMIVETGDIIHIKDMSFTYLGLMLEALDALKNATKKKLILSIAGNHDMLYRQYESIKKTATGVIFRTGIFTLLERTMVDDIEFVGVSEGREFGKATMEKSLLAGHVFYDNNLYPRESLFESQMVDLGYKWAVFGHDHVPYPPKVISNGITIIRPGAMMRGTTHKYNMYRNVEINILDTVTSQVDIFPIPIQPADKVLRKMGANTKDAKEEIEKVLGRLFTGGVVTTVGFVQEAYLRIKEEIKGDVELVDFLDLKFNERGLLS